MKINELNIENHFDELVFEGRNKSFGAYTLRKGYDSNISKAFLFSSILFLTLFGTPLIYYKYFQNNSINEIAEDVKLIIEEVTLAEIKLEPPPVILSIPAGPKLNTVKFVPPIIKKDEEVPETEEDIPDQEQLNDAAISNVTEEGEKSGDQNLSIEGNGSGIIAEKEEVLNWVAQMPDFIGGHDKLQEFFARNIRYPQQAMQNNIQGKVWVSFIVHKDGSLSDFKVIQSLGYGCDEEAMRVLKLMPKWNPGKANGIPKTVQRKIPIDFILSN